MKAFSDFPLNIQRMILWTANDKEFYDMEQSIIKDTEKRLTDGTSFVNQITLAQSDEVYDLVNKLARKVRKVEGGLVSVDEKRKMRAYIAFEVLNAAKENLGIK